MLYCRFPRGPWFEKPLPITEKTTKKQPKQKPLKTGKKDSPKHTSRPRAPLRRKPIAHTNQAKETTLIVVLCRERALPNVVMGDVANVSFNWGPFLGSVCHGSHEISFLLGLMARVWHVHNLGLGMGISSAPCTNHLSHEGPKPIRCLRNHVAHNCLI